MFQIYSFLLTVGFLILSPMLLLRREKYAAGFWQRLGYLPEFEQDGRPVLWLHCVSVGETNAARPLVTALKKKFPAYRLVVSTTTKTGQELARELFKAEAEVVFYFPFDWRFSVLRALKTFKPNIVLLMETELWFNFIREAGKSGALVTIVNGRLSEKSFKRYLYIKNFMRRVLSRVELALMQEPDDAKRIIKLGMRTAKVKVTGNIKYDQKKALAESDLTEYLRRRFDVSKDAPLIICASTHAPEEKWILEAFKNVFKDSPEKLPRLLIAPRHPERFAEVAALIEQTGFEWTRRSNAESESDAQAEIILLDSIGELRAAYALAEIVFVGGSLIAHGGQSIVEPAAAGKPIVTGFYTMNFAAAVREFIEQNAIIQLPPTDENTIVGELSEVFTTLLRDARLRENLAVNALAAVKNNQGATGRTIENLQSLLQVHSAQ